MAYERLIATWPLDRELIIPDLDELFLSDSEKILQVA